MQKIYEKLEVSDGVECIASLITGAGRHGAIRSNALPNASTLLSETTSMEAECSPALHYTCLLESYLAMDSCSTALHFADSLIHDKYEASLIASCHAIYVS